MLEVMLAWPMWMKQVGYRRQVLAERADQKSG